jgi:hypothetical protein
MTSTVLGLYACVTYTYLSTHDILGQQPHPQVRDPSGTSRNVPKISRGSNFDLLAFRRYIEPDTVVGTVGKGNGRPPSSARKSEYNPRPLAVHTRGLKIAVFRYGRYCAHTDVIMRTESLDSCNLHKREAREP